MQQTAQEVGYGRVLARDSLLGKLLHRLRNLLDVFSDVLEVVVLPMFSITRLMRLARFSSACTYTTTSGSACDLKTM